MNLVIFVTTRVKNIKELFTYSFLYSIITKKKGGMIMEKEIVEIRESEKKSALKVIAALVLVVASAGYIVYRIVSERAHNQKWKDYDECGLA